MRIAVVNHSRRRVGGTETYLSSVLPEMQRAGYTLALWSETDDPKNRELINTADDIASWCAAEIGTEAALKKLREWQPDLLYVHKVEQPDVEEKLLGIAPAVFFAHDYYGTCISGFKTTKQPQVMPCHRRFGLGCLLHYYPHRCGGLNPVTMLKLYRKQAMRLKALSKYKFILTNSRYLRSEYIRHGFDSSRVINVPLFAHDVASKAKCSGVMQSFVKQSSNTRRDSYCPNSPGRAGYPRLTLLFVGRMDELKGGDILLEALPQVATALQRPLRLIFAGDGTERAGWEQRAARLQAGNNNIEVDFTGWIEKAQTTSLMDECDLLVVPSLWAEPFGLVGVEAGVRGLPVAAFDVGGISTWLSDGENGFLAPGDPPTAAGLANAMTNCLIDEREYARLSRNSVVLAKRFSLENHLTALTKVFYAALEDALDHAQFHEEGALIEA